VCGWIATIFYFFSRDFAKKAKIRIRLFLDISERFENTLRHCYGITCNAQMLLGGVGLLAKMP
jgi:hypothetical protein